MTITYFIYTHSDIRNESYYQAIKKHGPLHLLQYIPLDNPTFHLIAAIQHELHHTYTWNHYGFSLLQEFTYLCVKVDISEFDNDSHLEWPLVDEMFDSHPEQSVKVHISKI